MTAWSPSPRRWLPALAAGALLAGLLSLPNAAIAAEPYRQFLNGLRRLEMHDVAIMYLENLRDEPTLDAKTKQLLPFEEGVSYLEMAKLANDSKERERLLNTARDRFEQFAKDNPQSLKATTANMELGRVLLERARARLTEANVPANKTKKDQLLKESRDLFTEARTAIEAAAKRLEELAYDKERYPSFIDKRKDPDLFDERQMVRADYLQARLDAAGVLYQMAKAYETDNEADKKKRLELLKEAAERHKATAEKHRTKLAGTVAMMAQGQCLQEIGDEKSRKQADALYIQLLVAPDSEPVVREIQFKTARLSIDNHMGFKEPQIDKAVDIGLTWTNEIKGQEGSSAEGLALKWAFVKALKAKHDSIKDKAEQRKITTQMRNLVRDVAGTPNPAQPDARQMLATLRGGSGDPETFAEARDLAKSELDVARGFDAELKQLQANLLAETDALKKKNLQGQIDELRKKIAEGEQKAFDLYQLALRFKDAGDQPVPASEVNQVRYFLAFLYFQKEQFWRASIMGDYLARKHVDDGVARPAAAVALASLSQVYRAAPSNDRAFEAEQMQSLASYIMETWPKDDVTAQARVVLIDVFMRAGERAKVLELLDQVPEDASGRPNLEIQVGNFLWVDYLKGARLPEDAPGRSTDEELQALADRARALLESGTAKMAAESGSEPSSSLLKGQLSLAQVYARSGQDAKALELLEAEPNGLLTLINKKNPLVEQISGFGPSVFKLGLQCFVNTNQPEKAEDVMDRLEKEFAGQGPEAQASLTRIYIVLGRELQEDLERYLQDPQKQAEAEKMQKSTQAFLARIGQRQQGNNYVTLTWVADTFYNMGEAAATVNRKQALDAYNQASQTYNRMMKETGDFWPAENTSAHKTRVQLQYAKSLRGAQKYEQALAQLVNLITTAGPSMDVQVQAALTLEEWGADEGDQKKLLEAMVGRTDPNDKKKKVVWGWQYLSQVAQRYMEERPSFEDYYHQARYHLAKSMYEYGRASKDADKRKDAMDKASRAITLMVSQFPNMGGDEWVPRYDRLLKDIQRELRVRADGLGPLMEAVRKRQTAAAQPSAN